MRTCKNCNEKLLATFIIDGKRRNLAHRKFCLNCSPFGSHNTRKDVNVKSSLATINKIPIDEFKQLVKQSNSRAEILDILTLRQSSASYKILNKRIEKENLDISHFHRIIKSNRLIQNSEIFIIGKRDLNQLPRQRILKDQLKKYSCEICSLTEWNGKNIVLQLDHINGHRYDNRLENLRFLCPNCHSQTETFCGKDKKFILEENRPKRFCIQCSNQISRSSKGVLCRPCAMKKQRKYERPTKEELEILLNEKPLLYIAHSYGCSDNTVRKWCVSYGIDIQKTSSFSRQNKIKKVKPKSNQVFTSKYKYVSFDKEGNKWFAHVDKKGMAKKLVKRFATEEEAAQAVAEFFSSSELLLRSRDS